jgi:DNA invertase Pin-like site-specific DNA recombinase
VPKTWHQCAECGIWFEAYACQKRKFCGMRCAGLHTSNGPSSPFRPYRESLRASGARADILRLYAEGVQQSEIARRLGVSRQRVSQVVRQENKV